ncbi:sulfur carrier protein ThiS [Rothia sp. AR01]|uniref:Sulfur carrier protein ThiS n=1 Tax=Rothia santali TaxID=2949643 RepID=A0A9X2KIU7_9MICC|nr:sulfur carrier protein ThiS [Rothia santali]MCP3426204.1 sulfur carrier protein ThiS [Rothia santali]
MITVTINGDAVELPDDSTVVDAVAATLDRELDPDGRPSDGGRLGVAVSLDAAVVPRSAWASTTLAPDAEIELVTAVQGG